MKKYFVIVVVCGLALWWRWQQKTVQTMPVASLPSIAVTPKIHVTNSPTQNPVPIPTNKMPQQKPRVSLDDPSFLPSDSDGNVYIENVAIDGELAIVYGDILVGTAQDIIELEQKGDSLRLEPPRFWPRGVVPYVISQNIPSDQKREIDIAIKTLNAKAEVKFLPREQQRDYVTFRSGGQHCYSNVGRLGGEQFIVLGPDCQHPQILHEMLHTLGLYHEQSRLDRDEYIMVMWENIEERYHEQFKKMPPLHFSIENSVFDINSIMMYPPLAFSRDTREPSILTIDGEFYQPMQSLSPGDLQKLKLLYANED